MDLIDKRDEVLRIFLEHGITENKENNVTKTDLAECAEAIVKNLGIANVSNDRELLLDFAGWLYGNIEKEVEQRIVDDYLNSK